MVTDFVRPESMEVPEGGLASFLTATVGEWADEAVPQSGIAGLQSVADHLAEYGRHEDTYMVHAAEGETVIPMAVLDENPRLKASLFAQMRSMGIDPERYVVGNELNSINPATGQPEFFLKSLWKGLKKAVKKVVKVLKKVAPIVLSIGLSLTPLGIIAGTALGSGIGTLIQGGSLKDALKMGAIGGLTAGLFKGVTGAIGSKLEGGTLGAGFKSGIMEGLPESVRAAQAASLNEAAVQQAQSLMPTTGAPAGSVTKSLATAGGPQAGTVTAEHLGQAFPTTVPQQSAQLLPTPQKLGSPTFASNLPDDLFKTTGGINEAALASASGLPTSGAPVINEAALASASGLPPSGGPSFQADVAGTTLTGAPVTAELGALAEAAPSQIAPTRPFTEAFTDIFKPDGSDPFTAAKEAFWPKTTAPIDVVRSKLGLLETATPDMIRAAADEAGYAALNWDQLLTQLGKDAAYQPNMWRKGLPLAGAGMGILALTGGFEQPKVPPAEDPFGLGGQSAWDLMQANPEKYRIFSQGAPYNVPTGARGGDVTKCIPHRNTGGNFPPRDGAIAGPGTGTSDDIRAMLSDGEFVMTARAVEGAGNGDRRRGVKKMYEVMRGFEGVA